MKGEDGMKRGERSNQSRRSKCYKKVSGTFLILAKLLSPLSYLVRIKRQKLNKA